MNNKAFRNIRLSYAYIFFVDFSIISAVLVPFFTIWGGLTLSQTFLLQAWFMIWSIILEIPTGIVADYLGRKLSLTLGAISAIIACLIYSSYPIISLFLIGEFLFALASSFISGADEALIYDSLKESGREKESNKILGRYETIRLISIAIAAPIGSIIAQSLGLQYTMLLWAVPIFFAFLISLFLREPAVITERESSRLRMILTGGFSFIRNNPILQFASIDIAVVRGLSFLSVWLYQPLLLLLSVPLYVLGFIASINTVSQALVLSFYPALQKKFRGVKILLTITIVIPAVCYLLAGITNSSFIAILSIVGIMAFGLNRRPLYTHTINSIVPSSYRATVLSSIGMATKVVTTVFYFVSAVLVQSNLQFAFIAIGAMLLIYLGLRQLLQKHFKVFVN